MVEPVVVASSAVSAVEYERLTRNVAVLNDQFEAANEVCRLLVVRPATRTPCSRRSSRARVGCADPTPFMSTFSTGECFG